MPINRDRHIGRVVCLGVGVRPSSSTTARLRINSRVQTVFRRRDPTRKKWSDKVVAIMASRFLVMPFVAAGLLMSGARMKLIPYDKVLWFVLLMQG